MALKIYAAASLDGFIADAAGGVEWLLPFQDIDYGYTQFLASVATVVMGRISYETAKSFGPWPYAAQRSIVISTQPLQALTPNVEVSNDLEKTIAMVCSLPGDTWIMGGAQVMGAFLDAGAVGHIELYVIPVLLGSGTKLFARKQNEPLPFTLTESALFPNGVVKTVYAR